MKKKIIIGILIVIGIGGFFWYRSWLNVEVVPTETVRRGDVVETVSVSGELVPVSYADLSFPGSGTLDSLLVKEGDAVEEGMKIASLDREVLWSQLKEARIAVQIAEETEKLARRDWDGLKPEERLAKKLATEQARENARTIKEQMEKNVLLAPFAGTISKVDVRANEVVAIGKRIVRLVQGNDFMIESRVPESDITKVAIGMMADVTFDAFSSDDHFQATVIEIDPASTVVQDVVSYLVKFKLSDTDDRLREGMSANIDIETAKRKNVLTVPFRALSKEAGKNYAEVKRGENQFEKIEVKTGLEGDEGVIEILSGLSEGDEVTIGARQKK